MGDIRKAAARQIISKNISRSVNIPLVSNVKCVRLSRGRHGFGFILKYCFVDSSRNVMKITMDKEENVLSSNFDDGEDASGSDADISSENSDTPCSIRENNSSDTIEKVFIQFVMPSSPADQAGIVQGDEVVNLNNSCVYGKQASEVANVVQNSAVLDVDIVEGDVRRRNKGKVVRGFRWNVYDTFASNHDTASDNGSSLSLTSGSSDNCTSPSSLSPPVQTGDRCFVVTYGKLSQPEIPEKETRNVQMHSFPLSSSYSDDEAQMETKPVCTSISEVPADLVSAKKINAADQRTQDASEATIQGMQDVSNKDEFYCKGSELTSSTSSSVLVESLDSSSKPSQTTCITVTTCTATYSTLASPQSTRGESEGNSKEDGSDTSDHRLKFTRDDNHVWELRSTQHTHVRPRSPSPAQRRVSYLMATEGSSSLSSGNWIVKSVGNEETACNLMTVKEESNQNLSRVNRVYQGENDLVASDTDEHASVQVRRDPCVLATLTSSEPVAFNAAETVGEHPEMNTVEIVFEEKRHSLKRKCSVEDLQEVEKEGYLSRKLGASHGRRSWKLVYVILKAHVLYIHKDKPDQMMVGGQDEKPISIKSAIVDIAYDYRKRENVFRLTTYNGSQYLFQAKDKDSMMSWIGAIQKNNNPDKDKSGVASENLIVRRKKNMDNEISSGQQTSKQVPPTSLKISGLKKSLSFKSNSGSQSSFKNTKKAVDGESGKATWHNKVVNKMKRIGSTSSSSPQYQFPGFSVGVPLERCPMSKSNASLPLLVEHCCQVVENKGLESVGIYRVPGNSANVAALEDELNAKTPDTIDFDEQKWNDANNMGSLLKKFLRKLPEGLVTSELYGNFIESNRKEGGERMLALKHLIQQLPDAYGETLRHIIRHLRKVSEHSDKNKMEIRNLAIVFGPTIVRTGEDNMMTMVNDMTDRFRIVESFITNYDWFFDDEPVTNGVNDLMSPTSPPVEEFSRHIVSSNMLNSIEQAAVSYEANDSSWKFKGPSLKLPIFKNLIKHNSDSLKKPEITSDHGGTMEHVESGKQSPVNLGSFDSNIRTGGGSQPNSPTTGRRKFIKRHHSATNIATTDVHDDFHRSKSEGEDEEGVFSSRTSHATKAYSYARPPPPSYRESRSKGSFKVTSHTNNTPNTQVVSREPSVSTDNNESRDFNSLSEETKKRLLRVTLQKKVSEKKKQKTTDESAEAASSQTPNETFENSQKVVAHTSIVPCDVPETVMFSQSPTERETDDQMVVAEPQLKASEIRKRFESFSESNRTACPNVEDRTLTGDPSPQLRKRDGPITCSSSRNFKIYSDAEVNFGQYRSNQINEWLQDMGKNGRSGTDRRDREHSERGRARAKTEEVWKGRRSASVSRASFVKDDEETVIKRRSLSCQDINLGDDDMFSVGRTRSKSSGSSDTSDEEDDPLDASSKAFDEKLHCMLQRNKMENRSKTELQPTRRKPHNDRPSSNRGGRSSVEKMRAMDPSSKIQSGAVSSMKSLFESGVPHQHTTKSRSSSVSSNSSGSVMSFDTQRRRSSCSTNPASDAEMKRRVWETDSPTREGRKKWKEPVWVAKERAMKSLKSDSGSSLHKHSDEINNNVRNDKKSGPDVRVQYARSASLPAKQTANDSVLEPANIGRKTDVTIGKANVEKKIVCEKTIEPVHNQPTSDKRIHVVKKFTSTNRNIPESSIHYEVEKKIPSGSHSGHSTDFKTPSSHRVVRATTSSPVDPQNVFQEQKPSVHSRRRIVSDSSHRVPPVSRHPNVRTFTAPILGTIVTTTTAFELEGFAFKPESNTRNPRGRCLRKSENQKPGFSEPRLDWQTNETLDIPSSSSHKGYRSPEVRRQGRLPVPEQEEDLKRLSTDRSILEQNALHIKELLDEMNTEHSLKMERQKSDTISINAQKSARKRAMRRRLSLGQDRENGVVVASCVSSPINERSRKETKPPLATTSNELQRNISTVKWVGVSS